MDGSTFFLIGFVLGVVGTYFTFKPFHIILQSLESKYDKLLRLFSELKKL